MSGKSDKQKFGKVGKVGRTILVVVAIASIVLGMLPASAEMLQGSVSKEEAVTRLGRPGGNQNPFKNDGPPIAPPRLSRKPDLNSGQGLVDTSAFAPPLSGNAREDDMRLGVVKPDEFNLPRGFDLGAERGSKELTLAWERWHKQFSQVIYERWSAIADEPGRATVRVTVDRNRQVTVAFVNPSASRRFDRKLEAVIEGMSGNQGLNFPSKSQRQSVSFEADYIAATNVTPGYSWVKNDYEKVKEQF